MFGIVDDRGLGDVLHVVRETEKTPPLHFALAWARRGSAIRRCGSGYRRCSRGSGSCRSHTCWAARRWAAGRAWSRQRSWRCSRSRSSTRRRRARTRSSRSSPRSRHSACCGRSTATGAAVGRIRARRGRDGAHALRRRVRAARAGAQVQARAPGRRLRASTASRRARGRARGARPATRAPPAARPHGLLDRVEHGAVGAEVRERPQRATLRSRPRTAAATSSSRQASESALMRMAIAERTPTGRAAWSRAASSSPATPGGACSNASRVTSATNSGLPSVPACRSSMSSSGGRLPTWVVISSARAVADRPPRSSRIARRAAARRAPRRADGRAAARRRARCR